MRACGCKMSQWFLNKLFICPCQGSSSCLTSYKCHPDDGVGFHLWRTCDWIGFYISSMPLSPSSPPLTKLFPFGWMSIVFTGPKWPRAEPIYSLKLHLQKSVSGSLEEDYLKCRMPEVDLEVTHSTGNQGDVLISTKCLVGLESEPGR